MKLSFYRVRMEQILFLRPFVGENGRWEWEVKLACGHRVPSVSVAADQDEILVATKEPWSAECVECVLLDMTKEINE